MNFDYLIASEHPNYTDWRLPENRIEAFSRVTHVRFVEGDLDHHHVGKVICDYENYSNDEKALYALYFGQSYRNHWAMIAMQLDFWNWSDTSLRKWHDNNWRKMKYGNDTKWNVRKFPDFLEKMKKRIGREDKIYEYLGNIISSDEQENYFRLNEELQSFYSIGRMTAWLAQQTLYEFFDWNIDYWDQQLWDHGTWSQYDSICYLFDRLDIARKQKLPDGSVIKYTPTREDIRLMEDKTIELMEEVNKRLPFHADIYNIESVECEYRKTAYGPKIKEFTFWTSNELVEGYSELKRLWKEHTPPIRWKPYVIGFMTKGKNVREYGWHKDYFKVVAETGLNLNTHYLYKDEPDAHELLGLKKNITPSIQLMKKDWKEYPLEEKERYMNLYNPVKYLKFKPKTHPAWNDVNVNFDYLKTIDID